MTGLSSAGRLSRPRVPSRGALAKALALLALFSTAVALLGVFAIAPESEPETRSLPVRGVTDQIYPSAFALELEPPPDNAWTLPVAAVPVDGATFVLDAGNARILQFDGHGQFVRAFSTATDARLQLKQPMAMVTDGKLLYIANSIASQVVVVDASSGTVQRVVQIAPFSAREKTPRIIGIALLANNELALSDGDNHRVLIVNSAGQVIRTIGTGNRATGKDGFNVPGAIATDRAGNLYIVDTLNGRVAEFSHDGAFIAQFGKPGATAGGLQRPKGVAVDASGRVFVSDGLGSVVAVYGSDGAYLGMIGRKNPQDPASPSLFRAPADLWLEGESLYVADRIAGVIVMRLDSSPLAGSSRR